MEIPVKYSVAAAAFGAVALLAGSVLAQSAAPSSAPDPMTVAQSAPPAADPTAAATPDQSMPAAAPAMAPQGGDQGMMQTKVVSNGPVPDTPANRALYGGPRSHAGRKTSPAGN